MIDKQAKQLLLFIEFGDKGDRFARPSTPQLVNFKEDDVKYVWTLYTETDKDKKPSLPLKPVHHQGAFLEDRIHDWNIDSKGRFKYGSRVTDEPVWVLVELK